MSGSGLTLASGRYALAGQGGASSPTAITGGAVSSWFRLAHPSTVITGSGYSSVHDVLNPTSPATQTTDALRPVPATAANGYPIVTVSAHVLSTPIIAARNGTRYFGLWGFFRRTGGAFPARASCRGASGATVDKWELQRGIADADQLSFHSLNGGSADSIASIDGASVLNAWQFETYEFNGDFGTDAGKCVITVNGVVQTLTFSGAAFPTDLTNPTGTIMWLAQTSAGGNPFVGQCGPNWGFLNAPMAGVTEGLLTPSARLALSNFERPTT